MGSPSILTNPMFNMGFLLVSMQLAKKVDWNDPQVVQYARFGFYGAQLLVIVMAYGLMSIIKKKNDTTTITYDAPRKPGMSSDAPTSITTTIKDYDLDQVQQFIKSTLTSIVIISVMHFQFKFTQPLLMQSIMPIKNFLAHKESLIHLWGDAPEGNLARPFAAENPFGALTSFLGGGNNDAPAATTTTTNTTPAAVEGDHAHQE